MGDTHVSKIYAQQLFKLSFGYPLWEPEPKAGQGEVETGDVGFLELGGFYRLFNAMKEAHEQASVPDNFKKLDMNQPPARASNVIASGPLFSQSVHEIDAGARIGSHGVSLGFGCECTDQQGALAIFATPGTRELHIHDRRMKTHMKAHIDSWYAFASEEKEINIEDILFVRGWVKTTRWAVVAFFGNSRHTELTFTGDLNLPVQAAFHVKIQRENSATCIPRIGPDNRPLINPGGPSLVAPEAALPQQSRGGGKKNKRNRDRASNEGGTSQRHSQELGRAPDNVQQEYPSDQCMFLHYFKLKKRFMLPTKIEAAAEPQDPSVDRDSDPDTRMIVEVPPRDMIQPYDPVIFVLDYILNHSEASVAIASDLDLILLCRRRTEGKYPIPDDIEQFLEDTQPLIEVTEDGLGMVLVEDEELETIIPTSPSIDVSEQEHAEIEDIVGVDRGSGAGGSSDPQEHDADLAPPSRAEEKGKLTETANILSLAGIAGGERRGGTSALAFSPIGQYVTAGFENNTIVVWDVMQNAVRHQFQGHSAAVSALVFSPDGNKLVSGGRDGKVFLWDLVAGGSISDKSAHDGTVDCVAYSHDGKLFASAAGDSIVKLWDAETGNLVAQTEEHSGIIMALAFSPDNERFVSACAEGTAHVWSTHGATSICDLTGHEGVIYTISYSPDGRKLVTGSDDGTCRVWSALIGEEYMTLSEGEGGQVWAAAFSPDGREVHYIGSERTLKTFDSVTADEICSIECGEKVAMSMTFSSDGRLFAAGGDDHMVTVWDTATREELVSLPGHTDNVTHVVFSKDNRHLATASDDGTLRKWELHAMLRPTPRTEAAEMET